jgi:hypothetical protein
LLILLYFNFTILIFSIVVYGLIWISFNLSNRIGSINDESLYENTIIHFDKSILTSENIKEPFKIFPELSNSEFKRWHLLDMENIQL